MPSLGTPFVESGCWLAIVNLTSLRSGLGVTAGLHRFWTHRSYRASLPVRLLLFAMAATAIQNTVYHWVRDHRVHHKHSDTNADPHNARRGFFYSHIGWLFFKKGQEVRKAGKQIDMSDLEEDWLIMFEYKTGYLLQTLFGVVAPVEVTHALFGDSRWVAFVWVVAFRHCVALHFTSLVNSAAHLWGDRP